MTAIYCVLTGIQEKVVQIVEVGVEGGGVPVRTLLPRLDPPREGLGRWHSRSCPRLLQWSSQDPRVEVVTYLDMRTNTLTKSCPSRGSGDGWRRILPLLPSMSALRLLKSIIRGAYLTSLNSHVSSTNCLPCMKMHALKGKTYKEQLERKLAYALDKVSPLL